MSNSPIGISGVALHVPPFRIDLQDWCEWTSEDWDKIQSVVGSGFRLPGTQQSVYTMAATAVLRLIKSYDIDPAEVRFLALGTESSTDNSAGAIIAKGMIDDALVKEGKQPLSRNCEVPEFKHACLGGIYALKNAIRFLNTDGASSKAIVVCSDIALYGLGTSGEPTQGAGAVAMLLETNPTIAAIDLNEAGSASDYRGIDFRKPIQYQNGSGLPVANSNIPVFNGRYSASCYIDEMRHALEAMYMRRSISPAEYLDRVEAVFMHRPFQRMPENGWGMAWLFSLATDPAAGHKTLVELSAEAGISFDALLAEIQNPPEVTDFAVSDRIRDEAFPLMSKVLRSSRGSAKWEQQVKAKISLGSKRMEELGNLYTGALPAWFAAGLEEAASKGTDLNNKELLLMGYGSGDAAEAIPVKVVPGWQTAVQKIDMAGAMAEAINLTKDQYLSLREGRDELCSDFAPKEEFVVDRVGTSDDEGFQDKGIEYYRYNN
ncbi:MAG: hydroxymethylglutaryl-CoA synthase family protein [Gammaproteobacteria bacterium]|nr:hydroxymethylglutaryl-CoA synthase family protein [Gammaproteobacteria bacterium]MCP4276145.1 hydroxymethylglutaryl-CoA synthase family protein [Gammaproteobacteria bacterium]